MSKGFDLAVTAVVVGIATASCGPSPITADRIQGAIAPTFADLVRFRSPGWACLQWRLQTSR